MRITDAQIREYLGHNGIECEVRIYLNGEIHRRGSPVTTDRSQDWWQYIGTREEIVAEMRAEEVRK